MPNITAKKSRYLVLLMFCVVWLWAGCRNQAGALDGSPQRKRSTTEKVKAPDFELKDTNGKKLSLSQLKGKVVFLDFWATWCPPCVASAPEVDRLGLEYSSKNVEVVSISLDDEAEMVRAFVARKKLSGRFFVAGTSGVDAQYRISGIPTFFIIDQEGYLVASWSGFSPAMSRMWRKELDLLLKA